MEASVNSSFEQDDDDRGGGNGEEERVTPKFNAAKLAKMLRSFADVAESVQGWAEHFWFDILPSQTRQNGIFSSYFDELWHRRRRRPLLAAQVSPSNWLGVTISIHKCKLLARGWIWSLIVWDIRATKSAAKSISRPSHHLLFLLWRRKTDFCIIGEVLQASAMHVLMNGFCLTN